MADTSDIRNGFALKMNGEVWIVVDFQHVKPGKGVAFVRCRLKNVKTAKVLDLTFRSGDQLEEVRLEWHKMQYLYKDADSYVLMDMNSYDQAHLRPEIMDEAAKWVKENEVIDVAWAEGIGPILVQAPMFVELKIIKADPGLRGDTATGGTKPATLETGAIINVPLFVNKGDTVKIDTRTGEYLGRA